MESSAGMEGFDVLATGVLVDGARTVDKSREVEVFGMLLAATPAVGMLAVDMKDDMLRVLKKPCCVCLGERGTEFN